MPNVEIHGLDQNSAHDVCKLIFDKFHDTSYVGEMVVTIFPTIAMDIHDVGQPFLRLVNSSQIHTEEIIMRLKTIGMDIEHLRLVAFIPRQDNSFYEAEVAKDDDGGGE